MGLISWIKGKYYDCCLKKADRQVAENNLNRAEGIYRSLLGKQDFAIVHLADMLVSHSQDVESKLLALKSIAELDVYSNEQNKQDYENCLIAHIDNIETLSNDCFRNKQYQKAVLLIDAIQTYRAGIGDFDEKRHRYHAHLAFSKALQSSSCLEEAIDELRQYKHGRISDIKAFVNLLKQRSLYSRVIRLLIPFLTLDEDFKAIAIDAIINVVLKKDNDICNPKKISEFCTDATLCKEAASKLVALSAAAAKDTDYKTSVLFDKFASEYFCFDNGFNNTRCKHILEELSGRVNTAEVAQLLDLTTKLNLTNDQIDSLKARIASITEAADPVEAIGICRLFKLEKNFNLIYINQAKNLIAKGEQTKIDEKELEQIVKSNTDEDSYADMISPFISIPYFEKQFLYAAVSKIKRHRDLSFLKSYWNVKESPFFFAELISNSSNITRDTVTFVSNNHKLFLHTQELKESFCKALELLHDKSYVYSATEYLILKGCNVNSYYVKVALEKSETLNTTEALSIIDHSFSILPDELLCKRKKQLIRQLIGEQNFELSEQGAKSLINIDDEAETLLAEVYYNEGKIAIDPNRKREYYFLVLGLCESNKVKTSFNSSQNNVLDDLCLLSREAYNVGKEQEAYVILDRIRGYHAHWLSIFIELRYLNYAKIVSLSQRIKFDEETLSHIAGNIEDTKQIDNPLYFELWDNYVDLLYAKAEAQPKDKAIASLTNVRALLNKHCNYNYASVKTANLAKDIVKLEWSYAIELEADIEYDKAIAIYEAVKSENIPSYNKRAELRALICHVKSGIVTPPLEQRIVCALDFKSHESLKDDLVYRYACYLLLSIRPQEAEQLLKKYLPNESALLALCDNIYIKESEKYLLAFNEKVKSISDGTMSVAEAVVFLQEIDMYKAKIANKLTDTSPKFQSYKNILESYIIRSLFNEEQYERLFDSLLSMYPKYVENDNQFRNVAIAALGLVESRKVSEKDLKYAISIWLSSVYTDRLFVRSLDYTSWDDNFTFTLQDSLGKTNDYDYDTLPENINFDFPIENQNIAIRDVQISLSSRMESFIRDYYPSYEQFFNEEKSALDMLIGLKLDAHYIVASPFLTSQLAVVKKSIKKALDYEIEQGYDNKEDVIEIGVKYGFTGNEYSLYKDMLQKVENCKNSLDGSLVKIRSAFSLLPQIRQYTKLYLSLKSFVSNQMNEDIKSKMDYKKFIDKYEIICKTFNEATLSLAFSNFANGEIVQRLNDDRMLLREGVEYMVRVYLVAPSSVQVKQNLEGMLAALTALAEQNNSSIDRTAVNNALLNTGNTFKSTVEDARVQANLSVIVDKVNNGSMPKDKALKEVYDLYKKFPDNDRICQNLITLCDMCIMEFVIADKWGASSVRTILDSLNSNKSATYNRHKDKLAQSYLNIWNQLDPINQLLLEGNSVPGRTLNNKGLALKAGLDYYKKLGGVHSPSKLSRLSGLSGLFNDDLPF